MANKEYLSSCAFLDDCQKIIHHIRTSKVGYVLTKHPTPPKKKKKRERWYTRGNFNILCMSMWWKHVNWVEAKVNQPKKYEKCMATRELQAAARYTS
jgi:hypothetical protein